MRPALDCDGELALDRQTPAGRRSASLRQTVGFIEGPRGTFSYSLLRWFTSMDSLGSLRSVARDPQVTSQTPLPSHGSHRTTPNTKSRLDARSTVRCPVEVAAP